ncbi:MAG: YggT family protein [Candidatus Nanopelagicaceae bacterium]|nr:YggT family protein [Candidatus Nanopelagicaceae bacterium]
MLHIGTYLVLILRIFLMALLGRLILDYIRLFSRSWRPKGMILYLAEAIYAITDKPTALVRRFIPPLRLGSVSLDLSFLVLFFAVQLLIPVVSQL